MTEPATEPKLDNDVFAFFGRKGSGKSYLVKQVIREYPRVIVIDSLAEYDKGFDVFEGKRDCITAMRDVSDQPKYRLALRCLPVEDNLELIDYMYEFPGALIVVEETSLYTKSNFLPEPIAKLVRYGRHREIDQFYIARRPSEVARDITAMADLVVSFQQREPRDVKYLRETAGDTADLVQHLPKYKCMVWGDLSKIPLAVMEARWEQGRQMTLDTSPDPE